MENSNKEPSIIRPSSPAVGVAYPIEPIEEMLIRAREIVAETGTSKPISKEEISRIEGKKVASLVLFFSTLVQYGIFNLVHGKGYIPSDLYRRYTNPVHDNDEHRVKLQMFKSPPLYGKILDNLNNHQLPSDEKRLANLLKDAPYNVNPNSAERAAKVFFENARNLRLLDFNNTLRFTLADTPTTIMEEKVQYQPNPLQKQTDSDSDLFELPIPLPNRRKAYLKYPLEDLTRKDIIVIKKAIEFIESSISDTEGS